MAADPSKRRLSWSRIYPSVVVFVLMLVYLFNQLDRFVLGIAAKSISRDLHFGRLGCFYNSTAESLYSNSSCSGGCIHIRNESA